MDWRNKIMGYENHETLRIAKIVFGAFHNKDFGEGTSSKVKETGWIDFYIRDKYLGRVENAVQQLRTGVHYSNSLSAFYYCGKCGEVWGHIEFEFSNGWLSQRWPCKKHGGSESLVKLNTAIQEISGLPADLITHEFS